MKYIVTFLSTTLLLSLMLHFANEDKLNCLRESERLSNQMIKIVVKQREILESEKL